VDYDKSKFPLMIGNDPVSELKVMRSAAGYYLGRSYFDTEFGFEAPYSRETGYMSEAEAVDELKRGSFEVRQCIENDAAYANGNLPDPAEYRGCDYGDD